MKSRELVAIIVGIVGIIVALLAWLLPFQPTINSPVSELVETQDQYPNKPSGEPVNIVSHSASESTALATQDEIILPIVKLFRAWNELQYDLYMEQWAENAELIFNGQVLTKQQLIEKRRSDFKQFKSVQANYSIISVRLANDGRRATVQVVYSMTFQPWAGKVIQERNITEFYEVGWDSTRETWLILKNYDYQ